MIAGLKKYPIFVLLMVYNVLLFAQTPTLVPLDYHPEFRRHQSVFIKNAIVNDTVGLPFIDDFSYFAHTSEPDQKLWNDRNALVNNNYPSQPRSNGVATLFPADTLT